MSVLVRGMKMPKNCKTCRFNDSDLFCSITKGDIDRDDYTCHICPLVEVPTPHGRLGDLDKLWDRMYNYIDNEGAKMPFGDNDFMIHRDSACELVEDTHTIIEAEGSDT